MRGGGEFAWRGPLDAAGFALLVAYSTDADGFHDRIA